MKGQIIDGNKSRIKKYLKNIELNGPKLRICGSNIKRKEKNNRLKIQKNTEMMDRIS